MTRALVAIRREATGPIPAQSRSGFIVAVLGSDVDPDEELGEFRELARTAGVDPVAELVQKRPRPDERTYVGKGKLVELQRAFGNSDAESLLVDDELTPAQQRRLEDALSTRVVDRTQLILDIFAQHAVSAEGKLQVELAQLDYNIPRMRACGSTSSGSAAVSERADRGEPAGDRPAVGAQTDQPAPPTASRLSKQRATRRKSRTRSQTPTVALAGYTNVGKSTLLNALTGAAHPWTIGCSKRSIRRRGALTTTVGGTS
jgi:GTP-binding protein HflX